MTLLNIFLVSWHFILIFNLWHGCQRQFCVSSDSNLQCVRINHWLQVYDYWMNLFTSANSPGSTLHSLIQSAFNNQYDMQKQCRVCYQKGRELSSELSVQFMRTNTNFIYIEIFLKVIAPAVLYIFQKWFELLRSKKFIELFKYEFHKTFSFFHKILNFFEGLNLTL